MDKFSKGLLGAMIVASLSACGGGGGGGGGGGTTPSPDPSPQVINGIATDTVSGRIVTSERTAIGQALVTINVLDRQQQSLLSLSVQSDDQGFFEATVPAIEAEEVLSDSLLVSFSKSGYTSSERVVELNEQSKMVQVDGILAPVAINTVRRDELESIAVSANGVPSLRFSLVKNSQGDQRILVGDVMAAADEDVELTLDLPVANIPESVEAISSEVAYFDSSNPSDIQNFPGNFVGQGDTEEQGQGVSFDRSDDDEEYRLISSTFSQIKLTDENQQPLPLNDAQASADGVAPSIVMAVPKGSYPTIQKDFDLTEANIQIPIYIYKSGGGWQFAGNGLLVSDYIGATPVDLEGYIADDGSIDLTGYTDDLFVRVEVTEANQWIEWINLDWPIKTGESTAMCAAAELNYRNAEAYFGYASITLGDGGTDWVYIDNGKLNFNTVVVGSSASQDTWELQVYNYKTNRYEPHTLNTVESTQCPDAQQIELLNPYACTLNGYTYKTDGTTTIAYQRVKIASEANIEFAYTDQNGYYTRQVLCDAPLAVSSIGKTHVVTVTDSSTLNFVKENQAPVLAAVQDGSNSIKLAQQSRYRWSTSDPEGDAIAVSIECLNDAGESYPCTINSGSNTAAISFSDVGKYQIVITASDGDKSSTKSFSLSVEENDNIAPEIIGFVVDGQLYNPGSSVSKVDDGQAVTIAVQAIDRNGDPLSYVWQGCSSTNDRCTLSESGTVVVTVADDRSGQATAEIGVVLLEDMAPEITSLSINPTTVPGYNGSNDQAITLFAQASDDFTTELTYQWSVMLDDEEITGLELGALSIAEIEQGALSVGEYSVSVIAFDGTHYSQANSATFEIVANQAPMVSIENSHQGIGVVLEGETFSLPITLTATIEDDSALSDLTIDWQLTQSGTAISGLVVNQDRTVATIPASTLGEGNYSIELLVTDAFGLSNEAIATVTIEEDKAPQINVLSASPSDQLVKEGERNQTAITLSASVTDEAMDDLDYQWTFSSGVTAIESGASATIAANSLEIGTYTATLTVVDLNNQTDVADVTFSVTEKDGNTGIIID
ncbi:hypothetical protein ST37_04815 [Vibrio sp. qd031]|uniref:PKD domain-containing protein n=1 Tax=Vibrio sp. qd031 TaxID=1603038 RepID=UPI000A10E984|nr:hypothetical protein [Vibrio sp. qd031]ORT51675.1 hypothetical protein ST37_04815 [Vibrio sp. qd031]